MNFIKFLIPVALSFSSLSLQASEIEAQRILKTYKLTAETWSLRLKLAESASEKQKIWSEQPDPRMTATELWREIAPSLSKDWSIPYAAFFLNLTRGLYAGAATDVNFFAKERQAIIQNFSEKHLQKPSIGAFAIALADSGNPRSLTILERISKENPDESTQGVAALAAALILKKLGDTPELIQKRLTYLRKAIIMASEEKVGETTVADIASDELYIIRFLSKGRVAPEFTGTDVSGRIISLSAIQEKIVILVFWDAKSPQTDKLIELTNRLATKTANQPVEIIGITPESLKRIRELQADGTIKWNNIIDATEKISTQYRINSRPKVLILNTKGEIEYSGQPGSFVDLTVDALLAQ